MKIVKLDTTTEKEFRAQLAKRSTTGYPEQEKAVAEILARVREEGDVALFDYAKLFDGVTLTADNISVTRADIEKAYTLVDPALVETMKKSAENIRTFHEKQRRQSWIDTRENGVMLGQRVTPMEIAGVYVPGGTAAYPSSVLMNVIPARVAGVKTVIMMTPAGEAKEGEKVPRVAGISATTLVAADIAGVDTVFRAGGAQAIAAMAYGTESVPKTDKITGPGNIFVALAKKAVFGHVSIDSIAGPSEVLILADETADPAYVAADLLAQAEHDVLASAILITTDEALAKKVSEKTEEFTEQLERREIIRKSLDNCGMIFVAENEAQMLDAANRIASEHVEILTADPYRTMYGLKHAGAIFLGPWSPEPLGDYFAGPNHILPTNGTARFFSPLNVDDFMKKTSLIAYSEEALYDVNEDIIRFADAEGLTAHAHAIAVRFQDTQRKA
ncbi:MAG: histidinol dehydrogenase [Lachnospiraceae bacterium]|nr:histidinol dehydrogenase [Lachnospiraceae bacterium]